MEELKIDFESNEQLGYYENDKEYYYVIHPKNNEIIHEEIWEFMGLELILNEEKKFKTLNLYKP